MRPARVSQRLWGKFHAGSRKCALSCFDIELGEDERQGEPEPYYLFLSSRFINPSARVVERGSTFGIEFRVTCHTYFIAAFEKFRKKWEQLFVGYIPVERVREGRVRFVFSLRILLDDLLIVTL